MRTSRVLLGITAGLAAGAVLGLLFAPDSGVNTRKKIAKKSQGMVDDLRVSINHLVDGSYSPSDALKEEAYAGTERSNARPAENPRKLGQVHS